MTSKVSEGRMRGERRAPNAEGREHRRTPIGSAVVTPIAVSGLPKHVAIIMDGNGRWAAARGRPRTAGHLAGARTVRRIVEHVRRRQIPCLTLYAFSSDNWTRPPEEVGALMALFRRYLAAEVPRCVENGIRLTVIGRRDRLSRELQRAISAAERDTRHETGLVLRLAVDYSARDLIVAAAARLPQGTPVSRDEFSRALAAAAHEPGSAPDVDLLIRTGGEQRLSDFLLWECAYAELVFSRRMWPDFTEHDFESALSDYASRERRFGAVNRAVG